MAYLNTRVQDFGLNVLDTEANRFDICTQEPTTYAEATTTYSRGNKTGYSVGSPQAGTGTARKVVCPAITDGSVTGNGTATHWAITDTVNSRLLAAGTLSASQVVTTGNTFTIGAFDIALGGV
jgi:hypothetical protein